MGMIVDTGVIRHQLFAMGRSDTRHVCRRGLRCRQQRKQMKEAGQLCQFYNVDYDLPTVGSQLGIALSTIGLKPTNGLRIRSSANTCEWFIWWGEEWSDAADFFQPLCADHLPEYCPEAVPFLGLPAGWQFLTDGNYMDVWYDGSMLTELENE